VQVIQGLKSEDPNAKMPPLPPQTTDAQIKNLVDFLVTLKGSEGAFALWQTQTTVLDIGRGRANYRLKEARTMRDRVTRVLCLSVAVIGLIFFVAGPSRADDAAALYKTKCAMCHGPDGSGNTPTGKAMKVADLRSDEVQKKTDAQLTETIASGKGKMPAFKGKLTDAQINDLVKYVRELAKKK
jgi:mono/diheme cytochrome c family protein